MLKNSLKSDTAREYRRKFGKEMPTRKLARIMYKENVKLYKDEEEARGALRYIEGKVGSNMKKAMGKSGGEFVMEEARPFNPYKLPDSDEEVYEPYTISGHKRGLIISDIHLPYQNNRAITACFDYAKKEKPDFVLINGDVLDFHQLSYFQKDPRKKRFSEELDMFKEFFQILKKTFNSKIYFKFGNHEERYDSYLFQKAHELLGVDEFSLENIISSRAEGIEIIKDKRIIMLNGLPVIHGHETGRGIFSPVNPARGLFIKAYHSCLKGDSHVSSEHPQKDILGKVMTTWSIGCLCGLNPKWFPLNQWNHGFAMIDLDENKSHFEIRNKKIYNGKIL